MLNIKKYLHLLKYRSNIEYYLMHNRDNRYILSLSPEFFFKELHSPNIHISAFKIIFFGKGYQYCQVRVILI